ncbi:MAG: SDR family oxidoreductase [Vicinamibacterales bacterium]
MSRRVAVTGMSINTPLGDTLDGFLDALMAGRSAVTNWKAFPTDRVYSKVGADLSCYSIPDAVAALDGQIPTDVFKRLRKLTQREAWTTRHSMLLATRAWLDSGLFEHAIDEDRVAVIVAGHNLNALYQFESRTRFEEEPDFIDGMTSLYSLDTDHAGCVSEVLQARGPIYTMGAACASGNVTLRAAIDEIRHHGAQAAVVVGAVLEFAPIDVHAMALMGAITHQSFNDQPARASRPYDIRREGFVPAHGGAALVLEELEGARARGARIYAEVLGAVANSDGNHLPQPSQEGQRRVMTRLLDECGVEPGEVDYINAHATSTPLGDLDGAPIDQGGVRIARVRAEGERAQVDAGAYVLGRADRGNGRRDPADARGTPAPLDQRRRARSRRRPRRLPRGAGVARHPHLHEELLRLRRHQLRQPVPEGGLMPDSNRRVMFLTGGSRGIGAGVVLGAVEAGWDVAFTYRSREAEARAVVARARAARADAKCEAFRLDVRDSVDVERVGDAVLASFDTVHAVVANAAVTHASLAFSTSDEEWQTVIDTNLTGAFYVIRQFLPELLANRFGRLIFISSIAAKGMAGDAAYCASKAGMLGLSASLAKEYGRKGITSNALLLSLFETEMTDAELSADKRQFYELHCPVGRIGQVADVAAAVLYLAGDGGSFVNGQEIGVTGGLDWFH